MANKRVAEGLLGRVGIKPDWAGQGEIAVQKFMQAEYDVILMDCQMPVMDGFEASRRIREEEARLGAGGHIPIIAVTANAMNGDCERCLEAGMDDYLTKPVRKEDLIKRLEEIVPRSTGPEQSDEETWDDMLGDEEASRADVFGDLKMSAEIEELIEEVGPESAKGIIVDFLESCPGQAEVIMTFVPEDFTEALRAAHTLKGTSKLVGQNALSDIAGLIESSCHDSDWATIENERERFSNEISKACEELQSLVDQCPEYESVADLEMMDW